MKKSAGLGKFIVLEGIDGVGKTTIAKLLCEYISGQYYKTPPSIFEQFMLIENSNKKQSLKQYYDNNSWNLPKARFLFFLSTLVIASQEINALLKNGHVVCDRYLSSTLAYHWALDPSLRDIDLSWLSILKPDIEFLLVINSRKEHTRRLENRTPDNILRLEDYRDLLTIVQDNFMHLNLIHIDVTHQSEKEVVRNILNHWEGYLLNG